MIDTKHGNGFFTGTAGRRPGEAPALSVLDLAFITDETDAARALRDAREVAQNAERLGYKRYWLAEHHNAPSVASAATAVLIGYVAEGTRSIRVGAGGIMLLNHSPLVIAEQFGTLGTLYPDRIDLGVGRAPGTDEATARALRRLATAGGGFPADVSELRRLLDTPTPDQAVRAIPGAGVRVPLWVLGSSENGARLAGQLGLPFAFAAHFAPVGLERAVATYRDAFQPSRDLAAPYLIVSTNALLAESDSEAVHQFSSYQRYMVRNVIRGEWRPLPAPLADIDAYWTAQEKQTISAMLSRSLVGSAATTRGQLESLLAETLADEIIVSAVHFTHAGRLDTYRRLADVRDQLAAWAQMDADGHLPLTRSRGERS